MGEETKIQWCDHTFNAWIGCAKISEGCKHCYAAVDTFARSRRARGLELWGQDAARHVTSAAYWEQPRRWNKAAEIAQRRHRVFCSSLSDVFEDREDLLVPRARLAMTIAATPHLDWLLLTKRPQNANRLWRVAFGLPLAGEVGNPWLPNIWLGTTVENQPRADERIPHLLATPAAVRFVSYEPAIGPVTFRRYLGNEPFRVTDPDRDAPDGARLDGYERVGDWWRPRARVDWIIVGGESGSGARPFDLRWARSTIEQCKEAGIACFVKQLGARPFIGTTKDSETGFDVELAHKKGGDPDEWTADLRVRQFPREAAE